jgi:hypothetical protein
MKPLLMAAAMLIGCRGSTEIQGLYVRQNAGGILFPCDDAKARVLVQDTVLEDRYGSIAAAREPVFVRLRGIASRTGSPKGGGQRHFAVQEILEVRARASGECPGVAGPVPTELSTIVHASHEYLLRP